MIGAIIGDVVGSRFEFNNHRTMEFELFTKDCFVTDDSIVTLAVARAIVETDRELMNEATTMNRSDISYLNQLSANTIRYMQSIGRKYPDCGYGGNFVRWMFNDNPQPYGSYGNGAAMRISPIGAIAGSVEEVKLLSRAVTEITHNHEEGIKGAEATAMTIFLARTGHDKEQIKK